MKGYVLTVGYGAAGKTIVPPYDDVRDALFCALQMPKVDGYGHNISRITVEFVDTGSDAAPKREDSK